MNFGKFLRIGFIKKTAGTLEINKDLQRAAYKNDVENEIRKISGRTRLLVRTDQSILDSK